MNFSALEEAYWVWRRDKGKNVMDRAICQEILIDFGLKRHMRTLEENGIIELIEPES